MRIVSHSRLGRIVRFCSVLTHFNHTLDWSRKFGKSFQKDLKDVALNNGATTSKLWDIYVPIMTSLRQLFPRRSYHAVFLDESNTFRFLSSLLRPLSLPDHRLSTSLDIAAALAQLPWTKFNKSNQFDNQTLLGCTEAGGRTKSIDTTSACHFTRQAQSPASFLLRKCGSLLDYAMMLCGVFLGAGMNAFVVIGTGELFHFLVLCVAYILLIFCLNSAKPRVHLGYDEFTAT